VCAEERRELSLPAAAGGLKTMGYGRMATHKPGGVLPGRHSPSRGDWIRVIGIIYVLPPFQPPPLPILPDRYLKTQFPNPSYPIQGATE
jgi:hypothetical protein